MFEDLPKPEFVIKDKSTEKLFKDIKPNKDLERIGKKKKRQIPKTKAKKWCNKKS